MIGYFNTKEEQETLSLGCEFAKNLKNGDVVALYGELGSGKTQFVKGICKGLDVKVDVTSPTFTIMNVYEGKSLIYHFDFYRVDSEQGIFDLGVNEFFFSEGICLIEWAEKSKSFLPKSRYDLKFELGDTENIRIISIEKTNDENIRN